MNDPKGGPNFHNLATSGPEGLTGPEGMVQAQMLDAGHVKILVPLPPSEHTPQGESMWAEPYGEGFKIGNIPFYDVGFTIDAIVAATPTDKPGFFAFERVLEPGPWQQIWSGSRGDNATPVLRSLASAHPDPVDFRYESMHSGTFVAVARGPVNFSALKGTLARLFDADLLGFWWDSTGDGQVKDDLLKEARGA